MLPPLPPEILDAIISHLPRSIPDLRSCSLVASSFREPSQRRIFHSIHLSETYPDTSNKLLYILSTSPYLPSFIRHIHATISETPGFVDRVCAILHLTAPWHVEELTIDITYTVPWESIRSDLRFSLLRTLSSPSCATLTVGNIYFPTRYLRDCSHLRHLRLRLAEEVTPDSQATKTLAAVTDKHHNQGYLESLSFAYCETAARFVQSFYNTTSHPTSLSLSHLVVCKMSSMLQRETAEFQNLLNLASASLQQLDFRIWIDSSAKYLDFSMLHHLRILRLEIIGSEDNNIGDWLIRFTRTLCPSIEELDLRMAAMDVEGVQIEAWREFEALLMRRMTVLPRITVLLYRMRQTEDKVRSAMEERLSKLFELGMVVDVLTLARGR